MSIENNNKLVIKRQSISAKTEFAFGFKSKVFRVKNFSEDPMYVAFDASADQAQSIKIPAGGYEDCAANGVLCYMDGVESIFVTGSGEVEVRPMWY